MLEDLNSNSQCLKIKVGHQLIFGIDNLKKALCYSSIPCTPLDGYANVNPAEPNLAQALGPEAKKAVRVAL